jgi:hypothetical protein
MALTMSEADHEGDEYDLRKHQQALCVVDRITYKGGASR